MNSWIAQDQLTERPPTIVSSLILTEHSKKTFIPCTWRIKFNLEFFIKLYYIYFQKTSPLLYWDFSSVWSLYIFCFWVNSIFNGKNILVSLNLYFIEVSSSVRRIKPIFGQIKYFMTWYLFCYYLFF